VTETERPVLLIESGADPEVATIADHAAAREHPGARIIVDRTPEMWP
jgi:hypothetical protein